MSDLVITTQVGGMNDYIEPDFLPETSYAKGINVSSRGGKIHTRPRFHKLLELPEGKFQGAFALNKLLFVVISGLVYRVQDAEYTQVEGVAFSPTAERIWATVVYDYLFMNDGIGAPAIVGPYGNRHLSRQDDEPELPCGTVCCFGQSRIFFADRYRRTLMASDVYQPGDPQSVLKFTEQAILNQSFSIRQPAAYGQIQWMQFIRNAESGTGLGQLVVGYDGGVVAFNVAESRENWLNIQIGQSWFMHAGTGGANSAITVGNDLFYRPAEGISTIRSDQSSKASGVRTTPLSMNISTLLKRDQLWTLDYVSAASANNRVLYTHGMRIDETYGDHYFDSLVALDLASFYLSGETQMTFDGLWIGPKITQILTGRLKGKLETFVCAKGDSGGNTLWHLSETDLYDGDKVSPRFRFYTRKLFFNDNAYLFSKFTSAEVWLEDMRADCSLSLYLRGDNELWQLATGGDFSVPYYTAESQDHKYIMPQGRAKVRIGVQSDAEDPVAQRIIRAATGFQFCIELTGVAKIARIRFTADAPNADNGETRLCTGDDVDIELTEGSDGSMVLFDYDGDFLI